MQWALQWRDLIEFEVAPVSLSREVRELFRTDQRYRV
jgi:hypothetical protein